MRARTLGQLLAVLGESTLQVITAPLGLDVPVSRTVIHDPRASVAGLDQTLLLAVGTRPNSEQAEELLRSASSAGLCGIVVKRYGDAVDGLSAVAEVTGVAVLSAEEDLGWDQLETLVASALSARERLGTRTGAPAMDDLFALANAVAAMVGGATAIEDLHQRILAYSTLPDQALDEDRRQGILGLHVPELPVNDAQYRELASSRGVCRFESGPGNLPRLALAIRAGNEMLGSIWVVDAGAVGPAAELALAEGADLAALHLLHARAADDLARRQRGELLRRVLDDPDSAALVAPQLGLDPDAPVAVAAFLLDSDDPGSAATARAALQLADLVNLHCEAHYSRHGCALIERTVYALLPAGSVTSSRRDLVADIAGRASRAIRLPIRAALGDVAVGLNGAAASRRDADLVLRVLSSRRPGDRDGPLVAGIDEVRATVALVELEGMVSTTSRLRVGVGPAVMEHDRKHGTSLAATLLAYLACGGDISAAARRLSIHPNTCRYRLARAEQLFNFDLTDPDERLVLWLQLRFGDAIT